MKYKLVMMLIRFLVPFKYYVFPLEGIIISEIRTIFENPSL